MDARAQQGPPASSGLQRPPPSSSMRADASGNGVHARGINAAGDDGKRDAVPSRATGPGPAGHAGTEDRATARAPPSTGTGKGPTPAARPPPATAATASDDADGDELLSDAGSTFSDIDPVDQELFRVLSNASKVDLKTPKTRMPAGVRLPSRRIPRGVKRIAGAAAAGKRPSPRPLRSPGQRGERAHPEGSPAPAGTSSPPRAATVAGGQRRVEFALFDHDGREEPPRDGPIERPPWGRDDGDRSPHRTGALGRDPAPASGAAPWDDYVSPFSRPPPAPPSSSSSNARCEAGGFRRSSDAQRSASPAPAYADRRRSPRPESPPRPPPRRASPHGDAFSRSDRPQAGRDARESADPSGDADPASRFVMPAWLDDVDLPPLSPWVPDGTGPVPSAGRPTGDHRDERPRRSGSRSPRRSPAPSPPRQRSETSPRRSPRWSPRRSPRRGSSPAGRASPSLAASPRRREMSFSERVDEAMARGRYGGGARTSDGVPHGQQHHRSPRDAGEPETDQRADGGGTAKPGRPDPSRNQRDRDAAELEEELRDKQTLLLQLQRLKMMGIQLTRDYTMDHDIDDIRYELETHRHNAESASQIAMLGTWIKMGAPIIDLLNSQLGPFVDLGDFVEKWEGAVDTHGAAIEALYRKWWGHKHHGGSAAPEWTLALAFLGLLLAPCLKRSGVVGKLLGTFFGGPAGGIAGPGKLAPPGPSPPGAPPVSAAHAGAPGPGGGVPFSRVPSFFPPPQQQDPSAWTGTHPGWSPAPRDAAPPDHGGMATFAQQSPYPQAPWQGWPPGAFAAAEPPPFPPPSPGWVPQGYGQPGHGPPSAAVPPQWDPKTTPISQWPSQPLPQPLPQQPPQRSHHDQHGAQFVPDGGPMDGRPPSETHPGGPQIHPPMHTVPNLVGSQQPSARAAVAPNGKRLRHIAPLHSLS